MCNVTLLLAGLTNASEKFVMLLDLILNVTGDTER